MSVSLAGVDKKLIYEGSHHFKTSVSDVGHTKIVHNKNQMCRKTERGEILERVIQHQILELNKKLSGQLSASLNVYKTYTYLYTNMRCVRLKKVT